MDITTRLEIAKRNNGRLNQARATWEKSPDATVFEIAGGRCSERPTLVEFSDKLLREQSPFSLT